MTIPVLNFGEYTICFEAQEEDVSARRHFITECGWSEKEFARLRRFAWFCATVSLWKDGEELNCEYLGCCSYKTTAEFYTRYRGDYFADMVLANAEATKDTALIEQASAWRASLHEVKTVPV